MNPFSFFFITYSLTCRGPIRGMYELQYMDGDIREFSVLIGGVKVSANWKSGAVMLVKWHLNRSLIDLKV